MSSSRPHVEAGQRTVDAGVMSDAARPDVARLAAFAATPRIPATIPEAISSSARRGWPSTSASSPMGFGYVEGVTHDSVVTAPPRCLPH